MIEIKLTVTPEQLIQIAEVLQGTGEPVVATKGTPGEFFTAKAVTVPVEVTAMPAIPLKVEGISVRKKGGKKGPKMAGFGRTQEQMNVYEKAEAARTHELDEEEELKKQRAEERKARQDEKQKVLDDKREEEEKEVATVELIKAIIIADEKDVVSALGKKPWEI